MGLFLILEFVMETFFDEGPLLSFYLLITDGTGPVLLGIFIYYFSFLGFVILGLLFVAKSNLSRSKKNVIFGFVMLSILTIIIILSLIITNNRRNCPYQIDCMPKAYPGENSCRPVPIGCEDKTMVTF